MKSSNSASTTNNYVTFPCLMTFLTASDTIWEWYSRLKQNTVKVQRQARKQSVQLLFINRLGNSLEVLQHVSRTEEHCCGVGDVPAHCLCKRVASSLEEKRKKKAGNEATNENAVVQTVPNAMFSSFIKQILTLKQE